MVIVSAIANGEIAPNSGLMPAAGAIADRSDFYPARPRDNSNNKKIYENKVPVRLFTRPFAGVVGGDST
jgi:hypothetical protein